MKLNNLSRLTALLLAIMLLAMTSAIAEDTGTDLGDVTGDMLDTYATTEEMVAAGYCPYCAEYVVEAGIDWPVVEHKCLYDYLDTLTPSQAYDLLIGYYNAGTEVGDTLYEVYIWSRQTHITSTEPDPQIICYDCSYVVLQPGIEGHDEFCPWADEEYTPSLPDVTTSTDVSTPGALANVTEVTLSFTASGTDLTYTWQRSINPDAESPVWTAIATGSTYPLTITPEAMAYAYRCVVTDANGNVVSTSSVFYLGGEVFFTWASTAEDVQTWLATATHKYVTRENALMAYDKYMQTPSIALNDVIHLTDTVLVELLGGTTLADLITAEDGTTQLIDTRYHIAVAKIVDDAIVPLD